MRTCGIVGALALGAAVASAAPHEVQVVGTVDLRGAPPDVPALLEGYGVVRQGDRWLVTGDALLRLASALRPSLLDARPARYDSGLTALKERAFHYLYAGRPSWMLESEREVGYYASGWARLDPAVGQQDEPHLHALAAAWARADRSPATVEAAWTVLRPALPQLLGDGWRRADGPRTVVALLDTDAALAGVDDASLDALYARLEAIQSARDDALHDVYGRAEAFAAVFRDLPAARRPDGAWLVSFWVRRHHEGNREVVRRVLHDLEAFSSSEPAAAAAAPGAP